MAAMSIQSSQRLLMAACVACVIVAAGIVPAAQ